MIAVLLVSWSVALPDGGAIMWKWALYWPTYVSGSSASCLPLKKSRARINSINKTMKDLDVL
jgi:hypothetical protein